MKDQSLTRVIAQVLALSVAGFGAGAAWAQDPAPPPPPPAPEVMAEGTEPEAGGLEEVVVQAQRRTESLQEVPMSIAAFNQEDLGRINAVTLEDLNILMPNVELEHVGLFRSAASFSMRGIGTSGIESFADPVVAVFVNGVYQARNATALSSTLDIEGIEVMRGPQGTIYGRNAYAGAIAVRTKRPEMNEFEGSGRVTFGNFNTLDADAIVNMPLIDDTLAARVAVRSHSMDGYYRNNGKLDTAGTRDPNLKDDHLMGENSTYIRPSMRWTPNDALDFTLFGEIYKDRSDAGGALNQTYDPEAVTNANCGSVGPVDGPVPPGTGIQCPVSTWELIGWPGKDPWGDHGRNIDGDGSSPWAVGNNMQHISRRTWTRTTYTLESNYKTDHGAYTLTLNYGDVE